MTFSLASNHAKPANPQRKVLVTVKQPKTIEPLASSRPQPTPVQDVFLSTMRSNFETSSGIKNSQWELPMRSNPRSISAPLTSIPGSTTIAVTQTALISATELVLKTNSHRYVESA
jgi:hypothetical protein